MSCFILCLCCDGVSTGVSAPFFYFYVLKHFMIFHLDNTLFINYFVTFDK